MSVPFKPHSVAVFTADEVLDEGAIGGYDEASQGTVEGMLYPSDSTAMFEAFGVETKRGHVLLCDPPDAPKFDVGGRVKLGSRTFAVVGEPLVYEGFGLVDNASVPLEELD